MNLPPSKRDDKVIRGKDGWLFLAGDSNDVLGQHSGTQLLSDAQLEQWRQLLEARSEWLADRDIPYFFLVAPDAHSVHPEKLPDGFPVADRRPVHQLIDHLAERSDFRIIYPLDELRTQRHRPVYSETSTHWTQLGALVALGPLTDAMAQVLPMKRLAESDVELRVDLTAGDLGKKLEPWEKSLHVWGDVREGRSGRTYDNRVYNHGQRIEYASVTGQNTCLVFGDSYTNMLLPFLAHSFRGLVFGHIETLDRTLVEEVRPDVVVTVMAERFLIRPPDDGNAPSLADCERRKREAGQVALRPRGGAPLPADAGRGQALPVSGS